ncbi:MAG: D-alanyl-D-alanine carboxypeptidase/D-alanyl-D-alanine-endopeptidase [Ignavibacteria bacterium]|nr:D-alanyl-D-alanine carboxypeptidase/D-alanyl-D-alanine-endopeptidase [Ignavibacteria bacterium]
MKKFFYFFIICFLSFNLSYSQKIQLDTIKSYDEFSSLLNSLISNNNLSNSKIGISIYSLNQNRYIYNNNFNEPLVPASVTKLFTSFFALNLLHSDPVLKTIIYTDAKEIKPVLVGNIYIRGGGDALLSLSDLDYLVESLINLGIKKIVGNIYADGSFFDGQTSRFLYSGDNDEVEYVPPVTSLSINRNTGMIIVSAGSVPGRPANVQVIPSSTAFIVNNNVKVYGGASKKSLGNSFHNRKYHNSSYFFDEQNFGDKKRRNTKPRALQRGLSIQTNFQKNGKQIITVSGSLPVNSNQKYSFKIQNPELVVAGALYNRLLANGIEVTGTIDLKQTPDIKQVTKLSEFGRDLCSMISEINKNSDNYLAENLFKIVGASYHSNSNNKISALNCYQEFAKQINIDFSNVSLNDGSGLSRRNKVTSETIVKLLVSAVHSDFADCFGKSLSIAGVDGTLKKRLIGTKAENNLIGKTGTHKNVSALAGYVNSLDGDTYAFAIVSNGWAIAEYKNLENTIAEMLSLLYVK